MEQNTNNSDAKICDIGRFIATVRSLIEKKKYNKKKQQYNSILINMGKQSNLASHKTSANKVTIRLKMNV